jgi:dTDP-3-amino-2,3,6-trideoxy-4-keto-D-glucose/dTDP-3-amino-3,4,6-trideoxy-alpha-D-glucose/dTDP-2,6-dideoxy-D-kanosamine transaminase
MKNNFKVIYNYLPYEFKKNNLIFNNWKKLIKSTDFTLGKYVSIFEKNFAKFCKAKYCISTNNGTDALIIALKSLGIKQNDEVITVTNSFYATTGAIVAIGAKPVFVDCDDRYQIDINKIEKNITKKTKAILPVHWAGASPDMKKILSIAKKHKLFVVEDACMGIGGKIFDKTPGTLGDIGCYSMHPLKTLNVMGDGGAILTNNKKIFDWIIKFRNHGMIDRNNILFWGVNARMQPLQAIVANAGLKKINQIIKKRNNNAKLLDVLLKQLSPNVVLPPRRKFNLETYSLYMILCRKRDKLEKFLIKNGVEVKIHYPIPLHLQKASRIFKYKKGDFPVSEYQAKHLLTIPVHQFINREQIHYIINKIKEFYK